MVGQIDVKLKKEGKFWVAIAFVGEDALATQGKSLEECLDNLKEAILGWFEAFGERK